EPDDLWAHPRDEGVARLLGLGNVSEDVVVRPEAVAVRIASDGGSGTVVRAVRTGPVVRLGLSLDDGRELEAAVAPPGHPPGGARVDVVIDPAGIVRLR